MVGLGAKGRVGVYINLVYYPSKSGCGFDVSRYACLPRARPHELLLGGTTLQTSGEHGLCKRRLPCSNAGLVRTEHQPCVFGTELVNPAKNRSGDICGSKVSIARMLRDSTRIDAISNVVCEC